MPGDWPSCRRCGGIRLASRDSCLAHAEPADRAAALERFAGNGDLDLRGVSISDALLGEILRAAPRDTSGRLVFGAARFGQAAFEGATDFSEATFTGDAWFSGALFGGSASFTRARFEENTRFHEVRFRGDVSFGRAAFEGITEFRGAVFDGDASFGQATFADEAAFYEVTFKGEAVFLAAAFRGDAEFDGASFEGETDFRQVTVAGDAWFSRARFAALALFGDVDFKQVTLFRQTAFEGDTDFRGAAFGDRVHFTGARFGEGRPVMGPMTAGQRLDLDETGFTAAVRIEADTPLLTCRRTRFPAGVRIDVRRALVRLDETDLSVPSLLSGPPLGAPDGNAGRPELVSLQGANVGGLTVGNVSLAGCRFAGAHNLDKLRLEADAVLGRAPAASWERRQVIAEEQAWRAVRARPGRWEPPPWPDPDDQPEPLSPGTIAGLYRALRKGREDAKDEPGAADFYYGEMEMRRHDRGHHAWRGRASRMVLALYWAVSGYGQRAWRSLAALAAVLAVFAAFFRLWGFTGPVSYWKSLLFVFRSTVSLTDSSVNLTGWGGLFQAFLRLTGPVLLGLAVLALRERVKR
jgi:Pentapeptide repeats (9 copies)